MCESRVVVVEGGAERVAMEEAARIVVEKDAIICSDIMGREIKLENMDIDIIDLMKHEIVIRKR